MPFIGVDEEVQSRPAFPPTRIIVVLGDLVETKLLVVVRTDPFSGVDRAFLQRRVNVATRNLLWNEAELRHGLAGPAADPHLETLQIVDGIDLLTKPAAHLG